MNDLSIILSTAKGHSFFQAEEIVRLEADSNYTTFHFTDRKKIITSKVLKQYVALLEPMGFVRTHRSHLVNRKYIQEIAKNGDIIMKDTSVANISRRMKSKVLQLLCNVN